MTLRVQAAGRTHVGLVRRRNEDRFYVGRSLLAVADGLGGHVAGDVASSTVVNAIKRYDRATAASDLADALGRAIDEASKAMRAKTQASPELTGMGTTLVAVLRSGSTAVLANVGDSRAYLVRGLRPAATQQISEDHTYGRLLSDAADVPSLPERLARFLDGRPDGRSPDLTVWQLHAGDRFLLCSDGLSSYVPHNEIDAALNAAAGPAETAEQLVALAIEHGGHDNVTVVVADILTAGAKGGPRDVAGSNATRPATAHRTARTAPPRG